MEAVAYILLSAAKVKNKSQKSPKLDALIENITKKKDVRNIMKKIKKACNLSFGLQEREEFQTLITILEDIKSLKDEDNWQEYFSTLNLKPKNSLCEVLEGFDEYDVNLKEQVQMYYTEDHLRYFQEKKTGISTYAADIEVKNDSDNNLQQIDDDEKAQFPFQDSDNTYDCAFTAWSTALFCGPYAVLDIKKEFKSINLKNEDSYGFMESLYNFAKRLVTATEWTVETNESKELMTKMREKYKKCLEDEFIYSFIQQHQIIYGSKRLPICSEKDIEDEIKKLETKKKEFIQINIVEALIFHYLEIKVNPKRYYVHPTGNIIASYTPSGYHFISYLQRKDEKDRKYYRYNDLHNGLVKTDVSSEYYRQYQLYKDEDVIHFVGLREIVDTKENSPQRKSIDELVKSHPGTIESLETLKTTISSGLSARFILKLILEEKKNYEIIVYDENNKIVFNIDEYIGTAPHLIVKKTKEGKFNRVNNKDGKSGLYANFEGLPVFVKRAMAEYAIDNEIELKSNKANSALYDFCEVVALLKNAK